MFLKRVTIDNFGIYRGHNEFDLSSDLNHPIVLCGGINGSGKTTLFESITLCLYGQNSIEPKITQKRYNQKILRLFHRDPNTKKYAQESALSIEFSYARTDKITDYKIVRSWQNNDGKMEEQLEIYKKDKDDSDYIPFDAVEPSQWQMFIDHLLPKGITKLFFFDGEKIQNIAESGSENEQIRTSLDSLLGLDMINQLYDDVGLYILRNSGDESKKTLDEIEQKTKEKREAEERLTNIQEKQVYMQSEIERLDRDLTIQEEKFAKLGGQFAAKRQELMIEKAKYETQLEEVENKIRAICEDTLPFCLIPEQMIQIRDEMKTDIENMKKLFEKNILYRSFEDIVQQFGNKVDLSIETKQELLDVLRDTIHEKIESLPKPDKLMFNFTLRDMENMIGMINHVDKEDREDMKEFTSKYNSLRTSLQKINTNLDVAPQLDEIGPLFSEIKDTSNEISILTHDLEHLNSLEAQEKSLITLLNSNIRQNLTKHKKDQRDALGLDLAPKVQEALEEYSKKLRLEKISILESNILYGIQELFHKQDFITSVSVNPETFEIKLYHNDDEITRDMLSQGELQIYATCIVWGLAKTSNRPLPFIIDTPLARLDVQHRENLIQSFYPNASHQTIILSTDSEIIEPYYEILKPHISKSMVIECNSKSGQITQHKGYFFDGGTENEVQ